MWRGEELLEESGSYLIELVSVFLHLINFCLPIDVTLEERSIKYMELDKCENKLYGINVILSLCNNSTALRENIRYFLYKYMIYDYEWYASNNLRYYLGKLIVLV